MESCFQDRACSVSSFISIVEFHNLSLLMITQQNVSKQKKMGNKSLSLKLKVSKGWKPGMLSHPGHGWGPGPWRWLKQPLLMPFRLTKVAQSSLNFNAQESKKATSGRPSPTATETVYGEVKKRREEEERRRETKRRSNVKKRQRSWPCSGLKVLIPSSGDSFTIRENGRQSFPSSPVIL